MASRNPFQNAPVEKRAAHAESNPELLPQSEHDQKLLSRVHPRQWKNPEPAHCYNLVVIGAGTAGLVCAAGGAALGGRVALVEHRMMGGDCLNWGCIPSKSIIRSSRFYADVRDAELFAAPASNTQEANFPAVMERMRRLRARISKHDSVERFQRLGLDVFLGMARFTGRNTVKVDGTTLRFKKAVIATGARPRIPSIEGLTEAGFLTNETVFNLTLRPAHLMVIGGGPLGCELAQAFCRLGSEVTIVQEEPQFLPKEERDAAQMVADAFERDGIHVRLNTKAVRVIPNDGRKEVRLISEGRENVVAVDQILVGVGRAPNVEDLNLEAAGVRYDSENGVAANDRLQTSNSNIYAAGDVCMEHKFTHVAEATARIVVQNALFLGRKKASALTIPWCTYTDPEVAHVGLYVHEAVNRGIPVTTFTVPMNDVDRAIADGEEEGFVKIHVRDGSDKILGATIVARHAGEMINEISLAMVSGVGLKTIGKVIHSYPTQAEAIKKAADAYMRTRLTPWLKTLSELWLAWTRRI